MAWTAGAFGLAHTPGFVSFDGNRTKTENSSHDAQKLDLCFSGMRRTEHTQPPGMGWQAVAATPWRRHIPSGPPPS